MPYCNYIILSYPLTETTPQYGKERPNINIAPIKLIEEGDSCNTYMVCMENHLGTHIDFPRHFHNTGKSALEYEWDELVFTQPCLCEVNLNSGQLLNMDMIGGKIPENTDILLIRSGWGKYRNDRVYTLGNPGISLEFVYYIRNNYPSIRAVGVDFVSVTSFLNREIGREAHRLLLDERNPILIIEDLNLDLIKYESNHKYNVAVLPYWKMPVDSSPCMVIAIEKPKK